RVQTAIDSTSGGRPSWLPEEQGLDEEVDGDERGSARIARRPRRQADDGDDRRENPGPGHEEDARGDSQALAAGKPVPDVVEVAEGRRETRSHGALVPGDERAE